MKSRRNFIKKLVMFITALMVCMIPLMVNAAEYVKYDFIKAKNKETYIIVGAENSDVGIKQFTLQEVAKYVGNKGWRLKSQKVTLSTKKYIKAEQNTGAEQWVTIKYKKPGTTKVNIKNVLTKGKKTKTITYQFTVKTQKFVTPVQSLKIDGIDYAKQVKLDEYINAATGGKKQVKFTYKLKKGWKLDKNRFFVSYRVNGKTKTQSIKNGGIITVDKYAKQKGGPSVYGTVMNTKTKQEVEIYIDLTK